jgi:hypothetical protein
MPDQIRRSALIAPFGPGAITVAKGGVQFVMCGLDHWFIRSNQQDRSKEADEYMVDEPRLTATLGVRNLYLPPQSRKLSEPNGGLAIPCLKFPVWQQCSECGALVEKTATVRSREKCSECAEPKPALVQVRFAAMCAGGHLQEFPWSEWVHSAPSPSCDGKLRIKTSGGASLASIIVSCECGKSRSLGGIMSADKQKNETTLSSELAKGSTFLCRGHRPWLGSHHSEPGGLPIRGTLLNATNLYYSIPASALFLPAGDGGSARADVLEVLNGVQLSGYLELMREVEKTTIENMAKFRAIAPRALAPYTDEDVRVAAESILSGATIASANPAPASTSASLRPEEYLILSKPQKREELRISVVPSQSFGKLGPQPFSTFFDEVSLVERLRETRAFAGFQRVDTSAPLPLQRRKELLWADASRVNDWLPAYVVYGEGIFLRLNRDRLHAWETRAREGSAIGAKRVARLASQQLRAWGQEAAAVSPRFVLLHTLSHIIINRLVFECGYSSASLRERLYCSAQSSSDMCGMLIYTAAGDSEGTMGGLVRMGRAKRLESAIQRALDGARWCSADPVCMEMGEHGQGPDSCNLAACHACGLVPETSCEEFNRFLDRGVLIGTQERPELGYFNDP